MRSTRSIRWIVLGLIVGVCGCGDWSMKSLMSKVKGPSRKELIGQMFESPDPDRRREAIEEIADHDWGRRDPYLKAFALKATDRGEDDTVRCAALRALARAGDKRYVGPVVETLRDASPVVRCDAAVALDSLPEPRAIAALRRSAVSDPAVDVRVAAAKALRHYRRKDVLETLLACLDDPEFAVRFQAGESLSELTGERGGSDAEKWERILSGKSDPFARPPRRRRRWYDRFRIRRRKRPATAPAGSQRPWWDWFGVTKKRSPATAPTTSPAKT